MNDDPFDLLMEMLDHPVFVVTTQVDGQMSGCLVSFATQISVRPSRFLVGLPKRSHTCGVASETEYLAVHVMLQRHRALAEQFDCHTGDQNSSRYIAAPWRGGPRGMPILDDSAAWFVGRTVDRIDFGDHLGYLLEPVASWAPDSPGELLYLSDFDDFESDEDDDGGHEEPHRFADREQSSEVARRYGLRFTIDGF